MARNTAKNSRRQTGTKNTRAIGGKQKRTTTVDPWGPIVPNRRIGKTNGIGQSVRSAIARVRGSATRKPTMDPQLRGMDYPKNDPTQWPVEPDYVNHTKAPDPYGITPTVITNVNESVNHAYTRHGGYGETT